MGIDNHKATNKIVIGTLGPWRPGTTERHRTVGVELDKSRSASPTAGHEPRTHGVDPPRRPPKAKTLINSTFTRAGRIPHSLPYYIRADMSRQMRTLLRTSVPNARAGPGAQGLQKEAESVYTECQPRWRLTTTA
eukprot:5702510-Pyramimonas_sp.AAC.1